MQSKPKVDMTALLEVYLSGFPSDTEAGARYFIESAGIENVAVAERDGKIVSAGYLVKKQAEFRGKPIPLEYISALATLTEYRRQNCASEVIRKLMRRAAEKSVPLIALNPFSDDFYKRYGFSDVMRSGKSAVTGGKNYSVREAKKTDIPSIIDINREFTEGYALYLSYDFDSVLSTMRRIAAGGGKLLMVYDNEYPIAFAEIYDNDFWLYGIRRGHDFSAIEQFVGCQFDDFSKGSSSFIQMRVANVQSFLCLGVYVDSNFVGVVEISDDIIESNNGKFLVKNCNGVVTVERVKNGVADYSFAAEELAGCLVSGCLPFGKQKVLLQEKY